MRAWRTCCRRTSHERQARVPKTAERDRHTWPPTTCFIRTRQVKAHLREALPRPSLRPCAQWSDTQAMQPSSPHVLHQC